MDKQRILDALEMNMLPCLAGELHPGTFCIPVTKELEEYMEVANWTMNDAIFQTTEIDRETKQLELDLSNKTPLALSRRLISLMYDEPSEKLSNCDLSVEAIQLQTLCLLEGIEELAEHLNSFSRHTRNQIDITRCEFYGRETYN